MTVFRRIGQLETCMCINTEQNISVGEMTIPIVGIPRGGTTAIAQVVHAFGIHLGPKKDLDSFHMEDQTIHIPKIEVQLPYIQKQNDAHPIWGWKDPTGITSVQHILFALRNPRIIIVFRDMLASIQGEMRFEKAVHPETARPFDTLVEQTLNWWEDNFRFVRQTKFPTLLVSYERALLHPKMFIQELAQFLHLSTTVEQRALAISRINPQGGYLS